MNLSSSDAAVADFGDDPDSFWWGIATAPAHQEDGLDDAWLRFAREGNVRAWTNVPRAEERLRAWSEPETDIRLAAGLGVQVYRMGVDWGRLVPHCRLDEPDARKCRIQNVAALERYERILRMARGYGMKVVLTLFHHSFPIWGTWPSADVLAAANDRFTARRPRTRHGHRRGQRGVQRGGAAWVASPPCARAGARPALAPALERLRHRGDVAAPERGVSLRRLRRRRRRAARPPRRLLGHLQRARHLHLPLALHGHVAARTTYHVDGCKGPTASAKPARRSYHSLPLTLPDSPPGRSTASPTRRRDRSRRGYGRSAPPLARPLLDLSRSPPRRRSLTWWRRTGGSTGSSVRQSRGAAGGWRRSAWRTC